MLPNDDMPSLRATVIVAARDAHDQHLVAIEVVGQIRADRGPGLAAIGRLEDALRAGVERPLVVRRHDDRRRPVPAQRRLARFGLRHDRLALAGLAIVADDAPVLAVRVDGVAVERIDDA